MSIPLSGSNIRLYTGIPWRNDYKHTRHFTSVSEQNSWFASKTPVATMSQANYVRIEGKYSVQVPHHHDTLINVNYMTFQNTQFTGKVFYCFVTKIEYINKSTTRIHFELDLVQTWFPHTSFQPSYVEREHCPQYQSNGLPVVNTIDEGLNYGDMYDTVSVENYEPLEGVYFLVIVCKQVVHNGEQTVAGTIKPMQNGLVQPLTFYVHPFISDGDTPTVSINNEVQGLAQTQRVLEHLYQDESMINNIVSLYVTKNPGLAINGDRTTSVNFQGLQVSVVDLGSTEGGATPPKTLYVHTLTTYGYNNSQNYNKPKYDGFRPVNESKLLMYPYALTVIDDFKGNRMEIKNEYIEHANLQIQPQGSLGVSNKISYQPLFYNMSTEHRQAGLEWAMIDNSPNDVPIITDMLSAYLQGNRNSLEVQKNSIAFNGAMGVVGSGLGVVSSVMSKDIGGGVNGLVGGVSGAGNSILQLQGMLAKSKDIDNLPPNLTKQGSNTYFDFGNMFEGVFIIKKQIKKEYQAMLEDYFKMYGYKVNRIKVPNIRTRQNFNFIKTLDCTLKGSIPQDQLVSLQTIFDNGITLWHTDDIGNFNLSNGVR